jgi:hypothetical protein
MLMFFNHNKRKLNVININCKKMKINYLFLTCKFIIFINLSNYLFLKNKLINNDLFSLILKEKYINNLFNIPHFSFLKNNNYLCIFIDNVIMFIDIIKILENKLFFYIYNKSISNLTNNFIILTQYNKYEKNYIYIQFILKKLKIKIIILLFLFLISIIKYIK